MAFDKERETYEARRGELLRREGEFVVIRGDRVAGIWPTYEEALKAGYREFGLEGFMVKQILAVEPVHLVTGGRPVVERGGGDRITALAERILDALAPRDAFPSWEPPEAAGQDRHEIRMRYHELKRTLDYLSAARQARLEWLCRVLADLKAPGLTTDN